MKQKEESRFYIYKCVWDDGVAPCVDNDLFSLTICKPYIRSTAKKGDLIFAFGSNCEDPDNRLVYIAEVSDKFKQGSYFKEEKFKTRQDCIYEWRDDGRLHLCRNITFHDSEKAHKSDLGKEPSYSKANALIAENFRYFGKSGTNDWKLNATELRELVEGLGQGFRVNFTPDLKSQLKALKNRIWSENPSKKILGKPLHPRGRKIDFDSDEGVLICNGCHSYFQENKR
jgi:hypothetical protein